MTKLNRRQINCGSLHSDIIASCLIYIIGHNYHGHYLQAGGLSMNNYVRENKVREVNVGE